MLIGIAKNVKNDPYVVSFVVNRFTNELTSFDVLYAINTKKEPAGIVSPGVATKVGHPTGSTISISDLLDYVNKYYPDILPEDVLKHYGYASRPDGELGESALYQHRSKFVSNREILANALETTATTGEEISRLRAYKAGVASLNEDAEQLADIKQKIKEIFLQKARIVHSLFNSTTVKKFLKTELFAKTKHCSSLSQWRLSRIFLMSKRKNC